MKRAAPCACACARPCPRAPLPYHVPCTVYVLSDINAHKHPGPRLHHPSSPPGPPLSFFRLAYHRIALHAALPACFRHAACTPCTRPVSICLLSAIVGNPSYTHHLTAIHQLHATCYITISICITATSQLLGVNRIHSSPQRPLACLATSRCLPTPNLCFFFLCTQAIATTSVISRPPMPNIYNKEGPIGYETTSPIQSFARDHNHATAPSTTPHDSQPSTPVLDYSQRLSAHHSSALLLAASRACPSTLRLPSKAVRVAVFVSSSTSSHNSSSSISDGFKRPPTFIARSRSCSLAALAACSRSSANSSALSPENSFSEMRKSRRITLNRFRSELVAKSPSMNDAI
jgi:hypothetical protein